MSRAVLLAGLLAGIPTPAVGQAGLVQPVSPPPIPDKPAAARQLGPSLIGLGALRVDLAKKEVSVPGRINDVSTLEFVATKRGGAKSYESAVSLDTDAITFNAALLLIGLDPARARTPTRQFDPATPEGDPVDIRVTFTSGGRTRTAPIEELLLDQRTGATLRPGPWVYTGSTFVDVQGGRRFLAELDGVLIGMMHGPSALLENPRGDAVSGFGAVILNPALHLAADSPVTLVIRALLRPVRPAK